MFDKKEWRKKNIEKRQAYQKEYYLKNKERLRLQQKEWRKKNWEKEKLRCRERRQKNKKQMLNYEREYRYKNKNKRKKYRVEYYKKIKLMIYNHYSNYDVKCNCCGERQIEFLTIDHIDNNGAKHRKNIKTNLINWIYKNNYPPEFQILCFNCNCAKGIDRKHLCPHQKERANLILSKSK